jgi:1-deoxy-D-xylulose-5-phosphate synthase
MADHGYSSKVVRLGVPDRWIEHGTQAELYAECGYDSASIVEESLKLRDVIVCSDIDDKSGIQSA